MKPIEARSSHWHWLFFIVLYIGIVASADAGPCEPWAGRIVSLQGQVQLLRGNSLAQPVSLQQTLCPGDRLSVGQNSRAEVQLPNETVLRLDADTVFNLIAPSTGKRSWVELVRGVVHFLSRVHGALDIKTPFINATIEGTELVLKVDDRETQLWVLEGRVRFANEFGSLQVNTGQSAAAEKGKAPVYRLLIKPRDAVQWALYYPPIVDYRPGVYAASPGSRYLDEAMADYRRGNLSGALSQLERAPPEYRDNHYFAVHAGLLLSAGRVDEANQDIQQELRLRPNKATPHALRAIIALAQNRKDEALNEARRATELEPNSPIGHIALSYAQQAAFNLDQATASTQRAIALSPDNALAHARLAELELSRGYRSRGIAAAKKAAALEPRLARTHTVLGFAYLTEIKINEAKLAFERAIQLDSTDPLARLGLGLTKIRKGKLKQGTEELELATSLDPNNSLIRSYLGKAYYEQRRPKIAETEFKNAKELDPKDPTPYFYDAIHKQTTNRPVEALRDLQHAIKLNGNRPVTRSSLQLDDDLAARGARLGQVYRDLGFEQRALVEGWHSLATDSVNYAAHRLLSDTYLGLPRHEMARDSELLQAQLLQPININPVQPRLASDRTIFLDDAGPANVGFNEYTRLFSKNGMRVRADFLGGTNSTFIDNFIISGIHNRASYSVGQFHYETNGFGKNNDVRKDITNAYTQIALTPDTSIQAEARWADWNFGVRQNFFFDSAETERGLFNQWSTRVGFRHNFSPKNTFIGTYIHRRQQDELDFGFGFDKFVENADLVELRQIYHAKYLGLTAGFAYTKGDQRISFPTEERAYIRGPLEEFSHTAGYVYADLNWLKNVTLTGGFSVDALDRPAVNRTQVNPKLGLLWRINPQLSFRGAVFRVAKRPVITSQTLEPTQIAGFNQFFDDINDEDVWRYGVGLDYRLDSYLFAGAEVSAREHKIPDPSEGRNREFDEKVARAYLYWTFTDRFALSGQYNFEHFKSDGTARNRLTLAKSVTHKIPIELRYYHPNGFLARAKITYANQTGDFFRFQDGKISPGDDEFALLDIGLGYRFLHGRGLCSLEVRNIFDTQFRFQDSDPEYPTVAYDRVVLGRVIFEF